MSSPFFQLLLTKPNNINEINRQVSEELKKSLPKGWGIIFKPKDNFKNRSFDKSDILSYEWILADFSDPSKYDIAYLFSEDLKKPLDSRRYTELPLDHYSLSISIDNESFILTEYQNDPNARYSPPNSSSRVKKGYLCIIDDNAIARIIRAAINDKEQTVIKIGNYKLV